MDRGEETIGLNGAAVVLDVEPEADTPPPPPLPFRANGPPREGGQDQNDPPRREDPPDRGDPPGARRGEDGDRPPLVRDRTPQPRRVPARTAGEDDLDPRRGESNSTGRARAPPQGTDEPHGGEIRPL